MLVSYINDELLNLKQVQEYVNERLEMEGPSREEYLAALRRRSSGFSRGVSKYRGVARYQPNTQYSADRASDEVHLYATSMTCVTGLCNVSQPCHARTMSSFL
jgi:hypothetical protein